MEYSLVPFNKVAKIDYIESQHHYFLILRNINNLRVYVSTISHLGASYTMKINCTYYVLHLMRVHNKRKLIISELS